jgi:hypothetical protein
LKVELQYDSKLCIKLGISTTSTHLNALRGVIGVKISKLKKKGELTIKFRAQRMER